MTGSVRRSYSEKKSLRRQLSFTDIYFASIGGQSPFLSILTYGTAMIIYVGLLAPIAALLGTLLVLLNGIVVYELSRQITKTGGYYKYAHLLLSHRVGIETGFLYLFYSILYGVSYAFGISYLSSWLFNWDPTITMIVVLLITAFLAISGIKPSTKYAIIAGSVEIAVLLLVGFTLMYLVHFKLSNPFMGGVSLSNLGLAVIYAAAIPTGYGAITPLSGEAKNPKSTIPRAVIAVILTGGILAAFDVYAFANAGMVLFHDNINQVISTPSPVLYVLRKYIGDYLDPIIIFAMLSDGVLGTLAFSIAASRTIYAMSVDGYLPSIFSQLNNKGNPIFSVILVSGITLGISVMLTNIFHGPLHAFLVLGALSTMAGLVVHLVSSFALARIGIGRRVNKWITMSVIASGITIYSLLAALAKMSSTYVEIFLLWMILAFIYAEAYSIVNNQVRHRYPATME